MKQLAEELTTGANDDIDGSGAGTPTVIGYTLAKLRTDETVDHGSAELATGKGIISKRKPRNLCSPCRIGNACYEACPRRLVASGGGLSGGCKAGLTLKE